MAVSILAHLAETRAAAARFSVRDAELADVPTLVDLENRCFEIDRLSPRNFQYLLTKGKAVTLVAADKGKLLGYAMVLFNAGTSLARLYAFAVDPDLRRQGVGEALLKAAEDAARARNSMYLRLEVRTDNMEALRIYRRAGYRDLDVIEDYYEDHTSALQMEKPLARHLAAERTKVPYYPQTLDFTCGSAALMMAMAALDPSFKLDRSMEIRLWREATTVFMTSGHGGCGPYGMGLAAWRRDYDVEIYVSDPSDLFVDSVRSAEKKEVVRLVEQDFRKQIAETNIKVHYQPFKLAELIRAFDGGGIPIVLVSSYRLYRERFPHWLVITGHDKDFIYAHDPLVEDKAHKSAIDRMAMPILKRDFERMARYGKAQLKAALIIQKSRKGAAN